MKSNLLQQKMPKGEKDKPLTVEEKFIITKLIAKSYIKTGLSGYKQANTIIEQHLNYKITAPVYNNFLSTIVRMAFRQLEEFLYQHTNKYRKPINNSQERIIRTPMIQCREWMSQGHIETFFKLVTKYYQLDVVWISVAEAESLYSQLCSLINNSKEKEKIMQGKRRLKQNMRIEEQFTSSKKQTNKEQRQKVAEQKDQQIQLKGQHVAT